MATNFPGNLDSYENPVGSDDLASGAGGVSHAGMHSNLHDAMEAVQAKVGVNNSTVTSSLDYRVGLTERGAPVGAISMFAGVSAPTGWLLCNGQQVSYATYPLLGAVFGVSGGTWNLPDLRQRVPVGSGTGYALLGSGGNADVDVTIQEANLPTHVHSINHGHGDDIEANQDQHRHTVNPDSATVSISDPGHVHNMPLLNDGTFGGYAGEGHGGVTIAGPNTYSATTGITASVDIAQFNSGYSDPAITISGGVTDHTGNSGNGGFANSAINIDVRQPFFVVNFIIRVDDI
jgi:microcystin-dependent protein